MVRNLERTALKCGNEEAKEGYLRTGTGSKDSSLPYESSSKGIYYRESFP